MRWVSSISSWKSYSLPCLRDLVFTSGRDRWWFLELLIIGFFCSSYLQSVPVVVRNSGSYALFREQFIAMIWSSSGGFNTKFTGQSVDGNYYNCHLPPFMSSYLMSIFFCYSLWLFVFRNLTFPYKTFIISDFYF